MRYTEILEKANRLRGGEVVEIDSNFFVAMHHNSIEDGDACDQCTLDCLCKENVARVCVELCLVSGRDYYLKLASEL